MFQKQQTKNVTKCLAYLLYGSVFSLPSPSSNIDAWSFWHVASLLYLGHKGYVKSTKSASCFQIDDFKPNEFGPTDHIPSRNVCCIAQASFQCASLKTVRATSSGRYLNFRGRAAHHSISPALPITDNLQVYICHGLNYL